MTYVETLLSELETYDLTLGVDFLDFVKRKLDAALHAYAMTNLKGFSEVSETHYYHLRKAAYISKSSPEETVLPEICEKLNVQTKTAIRLLEEVHALDTFQWFSGVNTEDGSEDIPVGIDVLGHCREAQPEQVLFHKETKLMLHRAFWKLDYKEQDIISRHLGFYKVCFCPLYPNTFEELADLYQYSTADGVMRFYHRTLDKLRVLLDQEGMFYSVRLKRRKKSAKEMIYEYTPLDIGTPERIEFDLRKGVIQGSYRITETAELDFIKSKQIGHASARLLLRLAKQDSLPADRVLPVDNVHPVIWKEKSSL